MARRATRTAAGKRLEAELRDQKRSGRLSSGAVVDGAKIICPSCGEYYKDIIRDYYSSASPVYIYSKSMPICKACAKQLLDDCTLQFGDPIIGLHRFCQIMDIYFNADLAEKTMGKTWLTSYITALSKSPYIGKSYSDTIKEGNGILFSDNDNSSGVPKKLIRRWGAGYLPEQYTWMQDEYDDWCHRYEIIGDKPLEILITNIVRTELEIQEASNSGADVNKLTTRLNTLLGSANLKPSQNTENEEDAIYPFGVEIERIENEMPIEPDEQFEDVDGVLKYIQIFSGHIAKMFNRPNRYSQLYEEEMEKYTVHPPYYDTEEESSDDELFNEGE